MFLLGRGSEFLGVEVLESEGWDGNSLGLAFTCSGADSCGD
jgi:hypothetical protein